MNNLKEQLDRDPYMNFLGAKFDFVEDGSAICSLVITEQMFNFLGVPHGGMIFSLADAALSAACNSDHMPSYAIDINCSFFKMTSAGDKLIAKADRINTTKRTGYYRIDVFCNEDLVATLNARVFRKET